MKKLNSRRAGKVALEICLAFAFLIAVTPTADATAFILRGQGQLPELGMQPTGTPGEAITVTVHLDSDNFTYLPADNPVIHYFVPQEVVPVEIIGSVTGQYADVSSIERLVALELDGTTSAFGDRIELDVAWDTSGTSLFSIGTDGVSGFDGNLVPHTPAEMLGLLADAMADRELWSNCGPSAVLIGSTDDLLFLGNLEWSLVPLLPGDFDADGDVDGKDFLAWQRDPTVGEIADWRNSFSSTTGAATGAVVPEPSAAILLLLGAGVSGICRRCHGFTN